VLEAYRVPLGVGEAAYVKTFAKAFFLTAIIKTVSERIV